MQQTSICGFAVQASIWQRAAETEISTPPFESLPFLIPHLPVTLSRTLRFGDKNKDLRLEDKDEYL